MKPVVRLSAEDAHIRFVLIKACIKAARKSQWSFDKIQTFCSKATAAEYENVLEIVKKEFTLVYTNDTDN